MQRVTSARRRSKRYRPLLFESLEQRQMLATITVTSLADNLNVDGQVTLREAIRAAELNVAVDGSAPGSGADTIQFAANLSGAASLLLAGDSAEGLSAFAITTDVTIRGNASGITIQRSEIGPEMRMFRVAPGGRLALDSVTLTNGFVRGAEGGAPDGAGGEANGGAIFNQGNLLITATTLVDNEVLGGDGAGSGPGGGAHGGAIYSQGGTVSIVNTTVSGNTARKGSGVATPPSSAGGIYSRNSDVEIYNSTITNNTADAGRSIVVIADDGGATVEIFSSIIAQADAATTVFDLIIGSEANGQVTVSGTNNLIRRQNDYSQIAISTDDPLLGPLLNNGGSTRTHALVEDSPAINRGSNPLSLSTDQRGASHIREAGGQADIGAFENQSSTVPVLRGDYNGNHIIDAADYVVWRKTLGTQVDRFEAADGNGNNAIDAGDFNIWRVNFGSSSGAAAIIMPALGQEQARESVSGAANLYAAGVSGAAIRRGSEKLPSSQGMAANDKGNLVKLELLMAVADSQPLRDLIFQRSQSAATRGDAAGAPPTDERSFDSNEWLGDAIWADWMPAFRCR